LFCGENKIWNLEFLTPRKVLPGDGNLFLRGRLEGIF
jgi:hypothetical protein